MKRRHLINLTSLAVLACGAAGANAQIVGSAHDFSNAGWADNQICKPCHTPHNAMTVDINGYGTDRLWNHSLPAQSQVYNTNEGDLTRDDALDAKSMLCMGCHDGTVALDSFGGVNGGTFIFGNALIGTNLTNDHPIGAAAVWDPAHEGTRYNPRLTWENSTIGGDKMGRLQDMLVNGEVESVISCITCHEPHRRGGNDFLTRVDNTGSAMCLACHIK
jgi:predicted CXXCH cytochrome family protein